MEDNSESDSDQNSPGSSGDRGEQSDSEEEQQFDLSLAASHSYMGPGLVVVSGRSVLEAGWEGPVPVAAHHGTVFPGETVPMLLPNSHDAALLTRALKLDKLFGLLCPDETGAMVSGYGALCEVFEVRLTEDQPGFAGALTFKARATHRFRFVNMPKYTLPMHVYARMRVVDVRVLPELHSGEPLRHVRLASLDPHRTGSSREDARLRSMDAAVTPWPLFLYETFDYARMRQVICDYFKTIMFEKLPEEPVSLSFWVASNLPLTPRDRLALFVMDNALLRLHMEVRFISRKSLLCCSSCLSEIARREHIFAMSSEGVHSNYTNLGGYMHDIVTVSRAHNTELSGSPSAEYSWFPGYTWTIALCHTCMSHLGWRFDAMKRNLRPQQFYGLCRNYVHPRSESEFPDPPIPPHPLYPPRPRDSPGPMDPPNPHDPPGPRTDPRYAQVFF